MAVGITRLDFTQQCVRHFTVAETVTRLCAEKYAGLCAELRDGQTVKTGGAVADSDDGLQTFVYFVIAEGCFEAGGNDESQFAAANFGIKRIVFQKNRQVLYAVAGVFVP